MYRTTVRGEDIFHVQNSFGVPVFITLCSANKWKHVLMISLHFKIYQQQILIYLQDHIQSPMVKTLVLQLAHFSEYLGDLLAEKLASHVTLVNLIWMVAHYQLLDSLGLTQLTDQG